MWRINLTKSLKCSGGFLCLVDLLTPRPTNESGVGADSAIGGYGDKYGVEVDSATEGSAEGVLTGPGGTAG